MRRSIWFKDEHWEDIKAKSNKMGLSVGKYLRLAHTQLAETTISPDPIPEVEEKATVISKPKVLKTVEQVERALEKAVQAQDDPNFIPYSKGYQTRGKKK